MKNWTAEKRESKVVAIRNELVGRYKVDLSELSLDPATKEGEKRRLLILQHFRVKDLRGNGVVMGENCGDFLEGRLAAIANTEELFDGELLSAGSKGILIEKLSQTHVHYFGGGFANIIGKKIRAFVKERYQLDERTGLLKAKQKDLDDSRTLEAMRIVEADNEDFMKPSAAKRLRYL